MSCTAMQTEQARVNSGLLLVLAGWLKAWSYTNLLPRCCACYFNSSSQHQMSMTPGLGQLVAEAVPVPICLRWVFGGGRRGFKNWVQGENFPREFRSRVVCVLGALSAMVDGSDIGGYVTLNVLREHSCCSNMLSAYHLTLPGIGSTKKLPLLTSAEKLSFPLCLLNFK